MKLTQEQDKALITLSKSIYQQPVTVLKGYAGSGKSFTISKFLEYNNFENVAFATPTGTAAKVLNMKNPELKAQTIHSLIYDVKRDKQGGFHFVKKNPQELAYLDLIIVDEFSMVDGILMKDLLSFGKPIILVGDPFQLPAVNDFAPNPYLGQTDAFLEEVHRQALDNPILWMATEIRKGNFIKSGVYGDDLYVGVTTDATDDWYRKDVQFLCGTNRTRQQINRKVSGSDEVDRQEKIIFLKNDYESGITNGTIANLDYHVKGGKGRYTLTGKTTDGIEFARYPAYYQSQLTWDNQFFDKAYAITVHKAQGQTIDSPIVIVDESHNFKGYEDQWLYTAVTRATGEEKVAILR